MTVSVCSPLIVGFEICFVMIVNDDLNVALHRTHTVSGFELYQSSSASARSCEIDRAEHCSLPVSGKEFRMINDKTFDALYALIKKK